MTPPKEPPSALESKINQTNREIQGVAVRVETLDQHLVSLTRSIEALTEQIGRLTESSFETQTLLRESANRRDRQIDQLLDQQGSKLDRILEAIQGQNRVTEAQASNISALTRLVEMLVSRN
jgi:chromosome segregation ATPase